MFEIKNFLLSDEDSIDIDDFEERKKLYELFNTMPETFFSKLRHFQPQVGCLNACTICSKQASVRMAFWTEKRQRNIIAALKYSVMKYRMIPPYIVYDRNEHRSGVIFSYLDNDIGSYLFLDKFIELCYKELGVKTRISTVGYSRHNEELNKIHARINENQNLEALAGVRLSFTPYAIGWKNSNNLKYSKMDYILDMANFLKIYRPYYLKYGSGNRKMCVEIRYSPLVNLSNVIISEVESHMLITTGNYMYISKYPCSNLKESRIADPYCHRIELTQKAETFYQFDLDRNDYNKNEILKIAKLSLKSITLKNKECEVYKLINSEGEYYSINPKLTDDGNYGINIYPATSFRKNSGYIITERFFLNELLKYKKLNNINSENATWTDAYAIVEKCKNTAKKYRNINKLEKSEYILKEVIPMIESYIYALQEADYTAKEFFDKNFTIDTGIICNMGRALSEFKGITYKENEPLTPNHERNYGKYNSTMTKESEAWRLSCDFDNKIIVEHLNLKNTATTEGQVNYKNVIELSKKDYEYLYEDLKENYFIPGQRRK